MSKKIEYPEKYLFRCHNLADLLTKSVDTESFKNCCIKAFLGYFQATDSFSSYDTERGLLLEKSAIEKSSIMHGIYFDPNQINERVNNYEIGLSGVCEVVNTPHSINVDVKNPSTPESMLKVVMGDTVIKIYKAQMIGYSILYPNIQNFAIDYHLQNTPDVMVDRMIAKALNYNIPQWDIDTEIEKIKNQHNFDRIPDHLKYKSFRFSRAELANETDFIIERIDLGQKWIKRNLEK